MLLSRKLVICFTFLMVVGLIDARAAEHDLSSRKLIVGTKQAPPFSMKAIDGSWQGISIDLWNQIASELNITFEFRESDLQGLLDGVAQGTLDVGVAALTVTAQREKLFDFTHPFYNTGLGIAVPAEEKSPWLAVMRSFFSRAFLQVIAALALLLLAVGILVWWFERKRNPQHFGGGSARGVWSGFWWSAVTMTTVGYGDKAPVTLGGRLVALIWMFTGIIVISGITAAITSALTVSQLKSPVQGPDDLDNVRVGTVVNSTSEQYLRERHVGFLDYKDAKEGLNAVTSGEIEALVYDSPLLRYLVNNDFQGKAMILPSVFLRQDYAIALQPGSPLREPINHVLLEKIQAPAWHDTLYRYLGE